MNEISNYILKIWKRRFPDDTMYQFSKRVNIEQATLSRMLKSKGAFKQAEFLMRIASVLGVSMESLLLQTKTEYDKDADLNFWKDKYYELENELLKTKKRLKEISELSKTKY